MGMVLLHSGAPGALVTGMILAAVPVAPLIACYLWLDRYEPEPRCLLASASGGARSWRRRAPCDLLSLRRLRFGSSATATHSSRSWWRRSPRRPPRACSSCCCCSTGATSSTASSTASCTPAWSASASPSPRTSSTSAQAYIGSDGRAGGIGDAVGLFVVRCVFSPFAHPFFTVVHRHRRRHRRRQPSPRRAQSRRRSPGTPSAVVAHASWNGTLMLDGGRNAVSTYVFIMVPAFLLLLGFAVWSRRREGHVLTEALADCAQRGFLDAAEVPWLARIPARRYARRYAETAGGRAARRTMVAYQNEAVELGFLHSRYLRGVPPPDFTALGQEHVARMRALRPGLVWPRPTGAGPVQLPAVGGNAR